MASAFKSCRRSCHRTMHADLRLFAMTVAVSILMAPGLTWGASNEPHGRSGSVLFGLAVLMVAAKLGGVFAERLGQPSVLGELLIGVGFGNLLPLVLGQRGLVFFQAQPTLLVLADMGVLILLFDVGLEANLQALLHVGWVSLAVAFTGTLMPLLLGWGAAAWLMPDAPLVAHVFVGATLCATSVGITARVLKDLGVAHTRAGQIILSAAVMDDVLGLVVLAVVSSAATAAAAGGPGLSALDVGGIVARAALFLGVTVGLGRKLSGPIIRLAARARQPGILLVFGLALCFGLAFAAELVGLADIIGAFAAGLMLDPHGEGVRTRKENATLSELMHPLSSLFVPLFFVLMGIQVHLGSLRDSGVLAFGAALIVCALAGKLACALVVRGRWGQRLAVGIGMIPRGEVGLIFAGIGTGLAVSGQPILSQGVFSAIVLMVLVTTLLAPVGLRWAFRRID